MAEDFKFNDIAVAAGVNLNDPPSASQQWVDAHWIRFVNTLPRTIKPYRILPWDNDTSKTTVSDAPITSIFSQFVSGRYNYLYGAATGLYAAKNVTSEFTNVTPLNTASVAIANSLSTQYITLANNPVTTTSGSPTLSIAVNATGNYIQVGDVVNISGIAGTIGGIAAASINGNQIVRSATGSAITITIGSNATSSATGGGAAGKLATSRIVVTKATHGLRDGERIKISGAADTGGILAASINKEFILRYATVNTFLINTNSYATSSVSSAGGASTAYYSQIADGAIDASQGVGYGGGDYGEGVYGGSPVFTSTTIFPQVWYIAPFGQELLTTAGNSSKLYWWDWNTNTAPTIVAGAPTDCNYVFVERNIVIVFRDNTLQWTDVGDYTAWTPTTTNYAGERTLFGSDRLVSHATARGENIVLFTPTQSYVMRFVDDLDIVWDIQPLSAVGIIAPLARTVVQGVPYWMGESGKFYQYSGGVVNEIPCSMSDYIRENISTTQQWKTFAWYNEAFEEIWFHWVNENAPSGKETSTYEITVLSLRDMTFSCHKSSRMNHNFTAAEAPSMLSNYPVCAQESRATYMESVTNITTETGTQIAFGGYLDSPWFSPQSYQTIVRSVAPESTQTGNIQMQVISRQYVQDATTEIEDIVRVVTPTTGKVDISPVEGRYWKYRFYIQADASYLNVTWQAGRWREEVKLGSAGD